MGAAERVLRAFREGGELWGAYVAARTAIELAVRAAIERGIARPRRCAELPGALVEAGILETGEGLALAEIIRASKRLHRLERREIARIAEGAMKIVDRLAAGSPPRAAARVGEGVIHALRAAGVRAAYLVGPNALAVKLGSRGLEDVLKLAAELSAELGVPPERLLVLDAESPGNLERVALYGRLVYTEDVSAEVSWLVDSYIELFC